jgi:hypothetical protein
MVLSGFAYDGTLMTTLEVVGGVTSTVTPSDFATASRPARLVAVTITTTK